MQVQPCANYCATVGGAEYRLWSIDPLSACEVYRKVLQAGGSE